MKPGLEIQSEQTGKFAIIEVAGEVDLYSSPKIRKEIVDFINKKLPVIIIDLSGVSYMDSSGVATMVEGLQLTERYDGKFYLCGLQSMVREVFALSRLDTVFKIFDDLDTLKKQIPLE